MSDVQKILVTLSEPEILIEPGGGAKLVVTMENHQDTPDRLSFEVEGLDVEWYSIPVSAVNVAAGAQASERINFKLARSSENRAGSYPFLVRVQAMETGEVGVAAATLVVKPYNALQLELSPRRAVATFFRPLNDFDVTVANLGNAEETLDLYASDPEDGCAYEFDTDRISLKAGQSQIVPMAIRPKVLSLLGGTRLYGFTVSARSIEDSYISANAHGQIEKHALISPLLGIFFLLLGFGGAGWYFFRPTPPLPTKIYEFKATATKVPYGQGVSLTWNVAPRGSQISLYHRVQGDAADVVESGDVKDMVGSIQVKPQPPLTVYKIVVQGPDGRKLNDTVTINVGAPPKMAAPNLKFFRAEPAIVHQGESVMLSWEATGQKEFILDPGNIHLSRYEQTRQITPDQDTTLKLRAIGEDDKLPPSSKSVTVHVVPRDACIAQIDRFRAEPADAFIGGRIKLKWHTSYARTVHIETDKNDAVGGELPASGSVEYTIPDTFSPGDNLTFTLTAADSLGKTTTKTLTVTPKVKPAPPQPATPTDPNAPSVDGTGTSSNSTRP